MLAMRNPRIAAIASAMPVLAVAGTRGFATSDASTPSSAPRPLTLMTLNTYLIPPFLSKRHSQLPETHKALTRAARISEFLAGYGSEGFEGAVGGPVARPVDLAFLQEVWGPGTDKLNLTPGFEAGPVDTRSVVTESWSNLLPASLVKTPWDWWRMWNAATGGLWFASRTSSFGGDPHENAASRARPLWTKRHTYTLSATPSRKGVLASLWDLQSIWGREHRYLLVVSTHLDAWNDQNKGKQLGEMADFVRKSILNDVRTILEEKEKEGWGGKPENWIKGPIGAFHADPLARLAVLFVGDFNIAAPSSADAKLDSAAGSHSSLYNTTLLGMMGDSVGPLVDYYAAVKGATNEASYDKVNNTLVEPGPGNHGRIDHILGLQSVWDDVAGKEVKLLRLKCLDIGIVRQKPGFELSDHYAVVGTFVPVDGSE